MVTVKMPNGRDKGEGHFLTTTDVPAMDSPPKVPRRRNLQEIAERLNISAGTVSRALSGRGEIAQATREKVAKIAAQLNYNPPKRVKRPAAVAQRFGVCVGNLCATGGLPDPSYVGLQYLVELERAASHLGVGLMVGFVDAMADGQRFDQVPVLQAGETNGLVLVYPFPEPIVQQLAARGPVVSLEHVYPSASLDTVGPAHSIDAMSAVQHLYDLGHRRIAYVCDDEAKGHRLTMGLRHAGYMSGLRRCGLTYHADDVVNVFPPIVDKAALPAWTAGRVRDGVTAVITSIDRHGYLLWDQLPPLGIRVPEDLSIVGIGGIHRAAGLPQLTTWRCNFDTISTVILDLLRSRLDQSRVADLSLEIPSVFVAGESAASPKA